MLDDFLTTVQADDAAAPFEPTADDLDELACTCAFYSMGGLISDPSQADFSTSEGCPIHDPEFEDDDEDDGERDFDMSLEYDGVFGLSGYDSFYDSCGDY